MTAPTRPENRLALIVALIAGTTFFLSTKAVHQHFDYTQRIALAFLEGHAGLSTPPPSWLSEMVPFHGRYYSVFPLGAVLSVIPSALLQNMGLVSAWPAHFLAAVLASGCAFFFLRLTYIEEMTSGRRVLLALFPIFASWTWTNLGFGGAWQMALGFALLGEAASLYYTIVRPAPLRAGAWFALAFGNRTEVLLTLPAYLYLLIRNSRSADSSWKPTGAKAELIQVGRFVALPVLLLLSTALYNWSRFGSLFDFGYSRIPGVLNEPWYQHGVFSPHAIPWNLYEMLFRGMIDMPSFPYLRPHAFGCSIFLASPFLFLLFRPGARYAVPCWIVIGGLTLFLWCHGNPGGWQFSYRYAITLLPWMFLLIASNDGKRVAPTEAVLFAISITLNGLATYLFLWTNLIVP